MSSAYSQHLWAWWERTQGYCLLGVPVLCLAQEQVFSGHGIWLNGRLAQQHVNTGPAGQEPGGETGVHREHVGMDDHDAGTHGGDLKGSMA